MRVVVGTSGWLYKDWAGRFYPAGLKAAERFAYFVTQFESVEVNSTFYHLPLRETAQRWHDSSPPGFTFAVKLNRYLTHTKRLHGDADFDAALYDFFDRVSALREKLGVVLVQLPPSLRADNGRLEHLAKATAVYEKRHLLKLPLAVEFRHGSWFSPDTFALMRRYNLANVINDSPDRWPASKEITANFAYIRFHGSRQLYRSSYTAGELNAWADFILRAGARCDTVFAYFNNDYNAAAVQNARLLLQKIRAKQKTAETAES